MYAVFHLHVLASASARMRAEFGSTACATFTQAREYMFWRIVKPAHNDGRPQHRGAGSGKIR